MASTTAGLPVAGAVTPVGAISSERAEGIDDAWEAVYNYVEKCTQDGVDALPGDIIALLADLSLQAHRDVEKAQAKLIESLSARAYEAIRTRSPVIPPPPPVEPADLWEYRNSVSSPDRFLTNTGLLHQWQVAPGVFSKEQMQRSLIEPRVKVSGVAEAAKAISELRDALIESGLIDTPEFKGSRLILDE
jgi:hypothetical protein